MATIHPVHVYLDANGEVTEWVVSDDDGYTPSERPGMVRCAVPRSDYDSLPNPMNVTGITVFHSLKKLCIPLLETIDAKVAAKCQASCDALELQIIADLPSS